MAEYDYCGFLISVEEADEGFKVYVKGDKEVLRPKLEAMTAYLNYREKAKTAGWDVGQKPWGFMMGKNFGCHGEHGHSWHGHGQDKVRRFFSHMQKAMKDAIDEIKD